MYTYINEKIRLYIYSINVLRLYKLFEYYYYLIIKLLGPKIRPISFRFRSG